MTLNLFAISDLPQAARQILDFAGDEKVFLFFGEMGAGKTTSIKALCTELGVSDAVSSPTFALINEYEYPGGLIYHFDCYRLKNPVEALDFGIEEYLSSGAYCFIEWPEKIEGLWPDSYMAVSITSLNQDERQIHLEHVG